VVIEVVVAIFSFFYLLTVELAVGVPHYTADGKLYTGLTHKDADGRLMTGAEHTEDSEYLYHKEDLKNV